MKNNTVDVPSLASSSSSTASSSMNTPTFTISLSTRTSSLQSKRGPQLEPIPRRHLCTSQNTAARLAAHHSTIGATACALQRPTEAQLRWAQFQSQTRAKKTRSKVEKLMQTPHRIEDVIGITESDYESCDCCSCSESSSSALSDKEEQPKKEGRQRIRTSASQSFQDIRNAFNRTESFDKNRNSFNSNHLSNTNITRMKKSKNSKQRKRKDKNYPRISKGRKALLRVSDRAYQQRRQKNGECPSIEEFQEENSGIYESIDGFSLSSQSRRIVRGTNRPSVLQRDDDDVEQRLQRFEEAYIAMATVHEQSKHDEDETQIDPEIVKRWKRPAHLVSSVNACKLDGRSDNHPNTRTPSKNIVHRNSFVFSAKTNEYRYSNVPMLAGPNLNLLQTLQETTERKKQTPQKRDMKLVRHENETIHKYESTYQKHNEELLEYPTDTAHESILDRMEEDDPIPSNNGTGFFQRSSSSLKALKNINSPSSFMSLSADILKSLSTQFSQKTVIDTDIHYMINNAEMQTNNSTLLLSPTILTKRLRQAIHAITTNQWKDVTYLLNANPWLAEMTDPISSQSLLHFLALHGSDAPNELIFLVISLFEDGIHKFDKKGNLPIHMAATSGNTAILKTLGKKFKEGASVRNDMGMLPLHLAVLRQNIEVVEYLLKLFPGGLAVTDGEGNLPLHLGGLVDEDIGPEMIHILLEYDKGVKRRIEQKIDGEIIDVKEVLIPSGSVKNNFGETPVLLAIRSLCSWEILEALLSGDGGHEAVENLDEDGSNAFHLVVSGEFADAGSALAILKCVPPIVSVPNQRGQLPIELACMNNMPREVLLGIILVDLPIDLNEKERLEILAGRGASWWFIACDCDDAYPHIIQEVLTLCNHDQIRELCFMKGGASRKGGKLIRNATPKSKLVLRKALRFVERYEFIGSKAIFADESKGLKVFEALDFDEDEDGKSVYLYCFSTEASYNQEISIVQRTDMDFTHIEEIHYFAAHEYSRHSTLIQYCKVVERPDLTLVRIIDGMPKDHEYRKNKEKFHLYMKKVCNVLRPMAKAIKHLHEQGVVHGDIGPHTCGKCGDKWKLLNVTNSKRIGELLDIDRLGEYTPPEAVEFDEEKDGKRLARFKQNVYADVSMDIWAFGKLCYEVFVGEVLIHFDPTKRPCDDVNGLTELLSWDQRRLDEVADSIMNCEVGAAGADLVRRCLNIDKYDRPENMNEILNHPFWKGNKKKTKFAPKINKLVSNKNLQMMSNDF